MGKAKHGGAVGEGRRGLMLQCKQMQQGTKKEEGGGKFAVEKWKNETTTNTRVVVGQDEKIKKQKGRRRGEGQRNWKL